MCCRQILKRGVLIEAGEDKISWKTLTPIILLLKCINSTCATVCPSIIRGRASNKWENVHCVAVNADDYSYVSILLMSCSLLSVCYIRSSNLRLWKPLEISLQLHRSQSTTIVQSVISAQRPFQALVCPCLLALLPLFVSCSLIKVKYLT